MDDFLRAVFGVAFLLGLVGWFLYKSSDDDMQRFGFWMVVVAIMLGGISIFGLIA